MRRGGSSVKGSLKIICTKGLTRDKAGLMMAAHHDGDNAMNQISILPDRLAEVMAANLAQGAHAESSRRMCVMEAVAYVAGEPWTDSPQCACPIISAFLRAWNDALPDSERNTLLKDLIPRLVGTRSTKEVEQRRGVMAGDWMIRVHTVAWLRLAKLDAQADQLEALPEITDFAHYPGLMPVLNAVRNDAYAAWSAAGAAARDAARDAAWAAARDAAWAAAWDSAWAAAWDSAWDAAGDAAWAAARAAALQSRVLVCTGFDLDEKHINHARARMEVWKQGYGLNCDVNGVLYCYRRPS